MPFSYRAFGLVLRTGAPVPGLLEVDEGGPPDVVFDLQGRPDRADRVTPSHGASLWYDSGDLGRGQQLRVWRGPDGAWFDFAYRDGANFHIEGSGSRVRASWPRTLTIDDVATYLVGPVLGFVLRLRGTVCLHASAVAVDDGCIAILAPAGGGKSTLAASFARHGQPVLSDDIVALVDGGERFFVQPGHPWLRLWPRAVEELYGSAEALPRITPGHVGWDKRFLDLRQEPAVGTRQEPEAGTRREPANQARRPAVDRGAFQSEPLPLVAIYTGEEDPDAPRPWVEAAGGAAALYTLAANAYSRHLLDRQMRAHEFHVLGRLASRVPLRRFGARRGIEGLPRLCDRILDDCRRARRGAAAPCR